MVAISSAKDFFLIANQKIENPPMPATATPPTAIPAIAPPESPFFSSGGVTSPFGAVREVVGNHNLVVV